MAENVIDELMKNLSVNGRFTISCGLALLDEDEFGVEWKNRAQTALE